jgi:hypothetical protein
MPVSGAPLLGIVALAGPLEGWVGAGVTVVPPVVVAVVVPVACGWVDWFSVAEPEGGNVVSLSPPQAPSQMAATARLAHAIRPIPDMIADIRGQDGNSPANCAPCDPDDRPGALVAWAEQEEMSR